MTDESHPKTPNDDANSGSDDAPTSKDQNLGQVRPDEPTQFDNDLTGDKAGQEPPSDPEISPDYAAPRDGQGRPLPKMIGGYQITRVLGTGGMSVVYAALQKQPRRPVALKLMKAEVEAKRAIHRFKREVEILGKLNHPCIAQVFDAGTHENPDGGGSIPYFVMEYIPAAKTIIQYAIDKNLSIDDRLRLFVKVCAAIEHGHRHKIVHRDLKPSNILIDSTGMPKVIDFGVARALELDVTSQTIQTEAGRLVGTIQYMSPEQVNASPIDIDARCDVYAMGVLMYKLLTGRHCYNLEGMPVYTAVQMICDVTPPRPSELKPELAGDLETIILKALEKDRTRRYRSAGSLGRDLVRFLARKPIHARPASVGYRSRLFFLRHRTMFITIAASVVIMSTVALAFTSYLQSVSRDRDQELADLEERFSASEAARIAAEQAAGTRQSDDRVAFMLREHTSGISSLRFNLDGSKLASGSHDYTAMLWDIPLREVLFMSDNHDAKVAHLEFTSEGDRLVTAADDQSVVVLDIASGALDGKVRHGSPRIRGFSLSPIGLMIAFGSEDLTMRIMDLQTGQQTVARGTTGHFGATAFNASGQLAAGSDGGTVYLFDASDGTVQARLDTLGDSIVAVRYLEEDTKLIAIDQGGNAAVWLLDSAEPPQRFLMCGGRMTALAFDPKGLVLACSTRREARVRDLLTGETIEIELDENLFISALAIDPNRQWLAIGDTGGRIHMIPIPGE
ncbi:MAG: serine/threonine-protein kinase [Planctomycetota bacterium]|nr:serine/threonine-protein kinase [Planctomycetota bacterium]